MPTVTERRTEYGAMSATLDGVVHALEVSATRIEHIEKAVQDIRVDVAEIKGQQHGEMRVLEQRVDTIETWKTEESKGGGRAGLTQRMDGLSSWQQQVNRAIISLAVSIFLLFCGAIVSFFASHLTLK